MAGLSMHMSQVVHHGTKPPGAVDAHIRWEDKRRWRRTDRQRCIIHGPQLEHDPNVNIHRRDTNPELLFRKEINHVYVWQQNKMRPWECTPVNPHNVKYQYSGPPCHPPRHDSYSLPLFLECHSGNFHFSLSLRLSPFSFQGRRPPLSHSKELTSKWSRLITHQGNHTLAGCFIVFFLFFFSLSLPLICLFRV